MKTLIVKLWIKMYAVLAAFIIKNKIIILFIIGLFCIHLSIYMLWTCYKDSFIIQEAYKATVKGFADCQLYLETMTTFRSNDVFMVPRTEFRLWFHAYYEEATGYNERIFYDILERPYYVIDFSDMGDILHAYAVTHYTDINEDVIRHVTKSIVELDPQSYVAVVPLQEDALEAMENSTVTGVIFLIAGIAVCSYIGYKLLTMG